ncbi:hypothetical protein HBH72_248760 [Parastagonospora nodorum]|nr:hypothetical protein HBH72_248760 [Parastagonospora nodorum]
MTPASFTGVIFLGVSVQCCVLQFAVGFLGDVGAVAFLVSAILSMMDTSLTVKFVFDLLSAVAFSIILDGALETIKVELFLALVFVLKSEAATILFLTMAATNYFLLLRSASIYATGPWPQ